MKEWGRDKHRSSLALKVEAIALAILWVFGLLAAITSLAASTEVDALPGGIAADGCYNDSKNGERHCHRGPAADQSTARPADSSLH